MGTKLCTKLYIIRPPAARRREDLSLLPLGLPLPMNLADCYQILGLRSGASYREIKAAYRRLAREYHPDTNTDKVWAEAQFIQLTTAYRTLLEQVPPETGTAANPYASVYSGPARKSSGRAPSSSGAKSGAGAGTPSTASTPPGTPAGSSAGSAAAGTRGDGAFPWETEPPVRVRVKTGGGQAACESANSGANPSANPSANPAAAASVQYHAALSEMDRQLKHQSYHQLRSLLQNRRFPRAIALVEGLAQRLPQDQEVRQWQAITYQRWGRQLIQEKQYDKARVYLKKALKADPHNKSLWLEVEKEFQKLEVMY